MKPSQFMFAAVLALGLPLSGIVNAQNAIDQYPARPVTWIAPVTAGGGVDLESRLYAQKMSEAFGKNFIIDYKPGAGTTIGAAFVAKAAPDGYTLLTLTPSHTISSLAYANLPYDAIRDFAPISLTSKRPALMVVHPSLPVKNLKEYIALAGKKPGALNIGTTGSGSITHIALEWMHSLAGVKVTYIHYKAGAPSYTALIAGDIDGVLAGAAALMPLIKAGKARAIAATASERLKLLPDVPTVQEQGLAGYDYSLWIGVAAPARTPPAIINRLSAELARIVRMPEVHAKVADDGTIMVGSTPEQLRAHLVNEIALWRKLVADSGIRLAE